MPSRCNRLNQDYQELLALKEQFSAELTQAMVSGDFSEVALLKAEITEKKRALESQLNPFEAALKIREQYETQKKIYESIGLLEKREGILGMEGIDGKWYAFPTPEEVNRRFCKNKELLDIKTDQGFTKLLIVPFGMSLKKFTETMEKTLLTHFEGTAPDPANPDIMMPDSEKTQLFATNADGTREKLRLHINPLCVRSEYTDTAGTLVYFPKVLDRDATIHQGKTKQELLKDTGQDFHILLIEKNPIIPAEGTDAIIGTKQPRKRLVAGDTPKNYLETLRTKSEYRGEEGLTPEAWMTQFLLHLEETNEVIDDHMGNGKVNFNLGGWLPTVGNVARGDWYRDNARAFLGGNHSKHQSSEIGFRSAVRI
jgi:hypothetical protein